MTVLPNKHVTTSRSIVGIGALLLDRIETSSTLNGLWESVKSEQEVGSFSTFVLALDYLYAIGAIDFVEYSIVRTPR